MSGQQSDTVSSLKAHKDRLKSAAAMLVHVHYNPASSLLTLHLCMMCHI